MIFIPPVYSVRREKIPYWLGQKTDETVAEGTIMS